MEHHLVYGKVKTNHLNILMLKCLLIASKMTDFRGKWIVVEGPDRIGKTTLIRNLQQRITHQGLNVMTNGFPRRSTPIGKLLDNSLKTHGLIKDWKAQTLTFLSDMLEAQTEMALWRSPENGSVW